MGTMCVPTCYEEVIQMDDLSRDQLQKLAMEIGYKAQEDARKANTFFSYTEGKVLIREYPDGHKTYRLLDENIENDPSK